jgi:large subunit ribosomal protein L6
MSRIGKQPIEIPAGVTVEHAGRSVKVKGPKGELSLDLRPEVDVAVEGSTLSVSLASKESTASAYHGLMRALINNMVEGVTQGYSKTLEIHGVGWNAEVKGQKIDLNVGFANTISIDILPGTEITCPNPETIVVSGYDKQAVGQLAARIRSSRPPEPYKGKGIRFRGEQVRMKAGKTFGS